MRLSGTKYTPLSQQKQPVKQEKEECHKASIEPILLYNEPKSEKKIPHWHQILYTSEIVIIPKEYDNWMLVTCSRLEQFPAGSGGNGMSSSLMLAGDCDEVCTAVNIHPNTILLNVPWHLYAQLIALIMTDVSHHLSWRGISPYSTVAWVHTAQVFRWRLA